MVDAEQEDVDRLVGQGVLSAVRASATVVFCSRVPLWPIWPTEPLVQPRAKPGAAKAITRTLMPRTLKARRRPKARQYVLTANTAQTASGMA